MHFYGYSVRMANVDYEVRVVTLPSSVGYKQVRSVLTEHAEYGQWELTRHRVYMGGQRKVWLRRKIIRVRSTFDPTLAYYS